MDTRLDRKALFKVVLRPLHLRALFSVAILAIGSLWQLNQPTRANACEWHLMFGDEFSGTTLDTTKWEHVYGSGGNGEKQYYAPDAFELNEGVLRIRAEKKRHEKYPYTSGIIHTLTTFSQQYGYFTMRAKLPKGQGLWPAFWLLPVSKEYPKEIDIFEVLGHQPEIVHMTHHFADEEGRHRTSKWKYRGVDYSEDFHVFAIEWNAKEIIWYIDEQARFKTFRGIPAEPMFMLANLAVGGRWPGDPDPTTPFPSDYEIDYIRVYQEVCNVS